MSCAASVGGDVVDQVAFAERRTGGDHPQHVVSERPDVLGCRPGEQGQDLAQAVVTVVDTRPELRRRVNCLGDFDEAASTWTAEASNASAVLWSLRMASIGDPQTEDWPKAGDRCTHAPRWHARRAHHQRVVGRARRHRLRPTPRGRRLVREQPQPARLATPPVRNTGTDSHEDLGSGWLRSSSGPRCGQLGDLPNGKMKRAVHAPAGMFGPKRELAGAPFLVAAPLVASSVAAPATNSLEDALVAH